MDWLGPVFGFLLAFLGPSVVLSALWLAGVL
jgi:hypothetical protein